MCTNYLNELTPEELGLKRIASIKFNADVIIIDTCSLIFFKFADLLKTILNSEGSAKILIFNSVLNELRNCYKKEKDCAEKERIRQTIELIDNCKDEGIITVTGSNTVNFFDSEIQAYVITHFTKEKITVITQDDGLAADLLKVNEMQSVKSDNKCLVFRINKYGFLSRPHCMFEEIDTTPAYETLKADNTVENCTLADSACGSDNGETDCEVTEISDVPRRSYRKLLFAGLIGAAAVAVAAFFD